MMPSRLANLLASSMIDIILEGPSNTDLYYLDDVHTEGSLVVQRELAFRTLCTVPMFVDSTSLDEY